MFQSLYGQAKPRTVVDKDPRYIVEHSSTKYPWVLNRLGIPYIHEIYGENVKLNGYRC